MQDKHKALILRRLRFRWLNKYKRQKRIETDVANIVASYTENTSQIWLLAWTGTPLVVIRKADNFKAGTIVTFFYTFFAVTATN